GWTFVLHRPLDTLPDGTFRHTTLQNDVAPGGRLATEVAALDAVANGPPGGPPVDVVWSPTLISQLQRMRAGYQVQVNGALERVQAGRGGAADAGAVLDEMRRLAGGPRVESIALPYAAPDIPSLIDAGLFTDLSAQVHLGRGVVRRFTGRAVSRTVVWPTDSYVDTPSLASPASLGVQTFVLDTGTVARPPLPNEF